MEIPFDIEDDLSITGGVNEDGKIVGIRICLRNSLHSVETSVPSYQRLPHNAILASKLVVEHLDDLDDQKTTPKVRLYKHQLSAARYLFHQDSLLLVHKPGTGKTETTLFAMLRLLSSGLIRRILVVNTSPVHNKKAKRTLERLYTLDAYDGAFDHLTFEDFVKRYVVFQTYGIMKNAIMQIVESTGPLPDIADMPTHHDGIIFDEAHNLVSEMNTVLRTSTRHLVDHLASLRGIKVILSTATPVQNDIIGFEAIRSLLLRTNEAGRELPGELVSFKDAYYEHLRMIQVYNPADRYKGRLPDADDEDDEYGFRIYRIRPRRHQMAQLVALLLDSERDTLEANINFKTFSVASTREPVDVGERGDYGFFDNDANKHRDPVPSTPASMSSTSSFPSDAESSTATSYEGKRMVVDSCIIENIIDCIDKSEDGVAIVYMFLLEHGAKTVCACLQKRGFEEYNGSNEAGKRTYLMHKSSQSERERKLFEDAKKPANWNGSIVKVIVGSAAMRDGIDIHHATQVHIPVPEWHMPGFIQAWHRGIRSNGHNWLLYNRAVKLAAKEGISLEEARAKVVIEYRVYNYVIDLKDLTDAEIDDMKTRFKKSSHRRLTNDYIRRTVNDRDRSHKEIELAIRKYTRVGPLMETLKKTSLDYYVNNGGVLSTTFVDSSATVSSIVFGNIVRSLARTQIKKTVVANLRQTTTTSRLVEDIRSRQPLLSTDDILRALADVVRNGHLFFVSSLGHHMRVKLVDDSVILVSDIDVSQSAIPTSCTHINVFKEGSYRVPSIDDDDLKVSSIRDVNTANKLQRALLSAFIEVDGYRDVDLSAKFLTHMTNFWGLCDHELTANRRQLSVYILRKHIVVCTPHVRRCAKDVITLTTTESGAPSDWTQARDLVIKRIVRPIMLVERYEDFDVRKSFPEATTFFTNVNWFAYRKRVNGIIMLKAIPTNAGKSPDFNKPAMTFAEYVDHWLSFYVDFGHLHHRLVNIKTFGISWSKGRQLDNKVPIKKALIDELITGVYLVFFPYALPEHGNGSLLEQMLALKRRELADINDAEDGNPCWQHRLLIVEYLAYAGKISIERRREIYRTLWSRPVIEQDA